MHISNNIFSSCCWKSVCDTKWGQRLGVVGRDWAEAKETAEKGDARTFFWNGFVKGSDLSKGVEGWVSLKYLGELEVVENGWRV